MKPIVIASGVIGLVFVGVGLMYFITPASSLPSFLPGYDASSNAVHFKHGVGSLLLGVAAFVFAWFKTGNKSA